MALLLLLSSFPRWETCLPSILPGSALEGARERIDCCTALCSERFLSPLTPSQLALWGRNLIRGKYHQSWWALATTTPPTCCLLFSGSKPGEIDANSFCGGYTSCVFASMVQGELRECDCRGGREGRVPLFTFLSDADCRALVCCRRGESTETKCAKKVRFENFFGGNFACVWLQAATSNYSNHLFNPFMIIFS